MIPVLSIVFMIVTALCCIAIPLVLMFVFYKKFGASIKAFFIGCGVMLLFALILESLVHTLVGKSPLADVLNTNFWAYAVYGGLMAGIFEETGRFLAFKTVLKKDMNNDHNALMYGAGHGGFEAVAIVGLTMISNITTSIMYNTGALDAIVSQLGAEGYAQYQAAINTLVTTPSWMFLIGLLERIFAIVLHVSLSVIVWFAVKNASRIWLFPAAILLHALVDGSMVIFNYLFKSTFVTELVVGISSAILAVIACFVWRANTAKAENVTE